MAERVARGQGAEASPAAPPAGPSEPASRREEGSAASPVKHCWVADEHGRLPALLLAWRRTESGYQGRVVRPVPDEDGWVVVDEWLPADRLGPA